MWCVGRDLEGSSHELFKGVFQKLLRGNEENQNSHNKNNQH